MADAELPIPGDVIAGRYRVEQQLGAGGMGAVYRAIQIGLEREVALKLILPHKAQAQQSRDRFLREARISASLRHPGIVEIYDFGEIETTLFLAMELLRGESLREWVDYDKPPLSLARAMNITRQIAEVLDFAAERGAVHRDLKPENVIYDRDGDRERIVIVDFGLAFIQSADDATGRLTREGVVTGTPDYMSPEQCRGKADVGGAADVYSLGCMLYEMLTSRVPFNGDVGIVISRHLFVQPKSIREAFPELNVPGAIDDLVMQMLAKTPEDRPTPRAVLDALEGFNPAAPRRFSGRDESDARLGRAARMVSIAAKPASTPPKRSSNERVAWIGVIDPAVETGLSVNGIEAISGSLESLDTLGEVSAIVALGASVEALRALCGRGLPVITDAAAGDQDRLHALLSAGVDEVLVGGWDAGLAAKKIHRALRKAHRVRRQENQT